MSSCINSCPQCLQFKSSSLAWYLSLKIAIGQQLEQEDSAFKHPLTLFVLYQTLSALALKSYASSHLLMLRFGDEGYWADVRSVTALPTSMFADRAGT
ncbi:hypothetical protein B0H12DRAFT_1242494 [Mycena haematopus]|nr:hypothetical protein B0H12DRAFT_1242494 [Mycena haematopus]